MKFLLQQYAYRLFVADGRVTLFRKLIFFLVGGRIRFFRF